MGILEGHYKSKILFNLYCKMQLKAQWHTLTQSFYSLSFDLAFGRRGMDFMLSLVLGQVPKTNGMQFELFCVNNGR